VRSWRDLLETAKDEYERSVDPDQSELVAS
jgi:WhiB family redox-sensing transcriptional regulator